MANHTPRMGKFYANEEDRRHGISGAVYVKGFGSVRYLDDNGRRYFSCEDMQICCGYTVTASAITRIAKSEPLYVMDDGSCNYTAFVDEQDARLYLSHVRSARAKEFAKVAGSELFQWHKAEEPAANKVEHDDILAELKALNENIVALRSLIETVFNV